MTSTSIHPGMVGERNLDFLGEDLLAAGAGAAVTTVELEQ